MTNSTILKIAKQHIVSEVWKDQIAKCGSLTSAYLLDVDACVKYTCYFHIA